MSSLPYRSNVCLIILNEQDQVLLGERISNSGRWQLPQGGLEDGHDLENDSVVLANALREAAEETGAPEQGFLVEKILNARHFYDFEVPPPYAYDRYRGQTQRFVVLRYEGDSAALQPLSVAHPEFSAFRWVELSDVIDTAEQRRRAGYEAALKELALYLNELNNDNN